MTRTPNERNDVLAGRYIDGEMSPDDRRAFEALLSGEPELAAKIRELRAMREWFVAGPVPRPSPHFRDDVLAAALRGASTVADDLRLVSWSRRVLYAAAALIVLGILVASGVLRPAYGGKLEASPAEVEHAMDRLDAQIAAELGRGDRR
jgi:anti-sigma factor RsiW